ncbi:MAG: hypothetical protein WBF17_15950, partial [Phycisphaerae bacterium]
PGRKAVALRLAPLLSETEKVPAPRYGGDRDERLCESAAAAMATLLGWEGDVAPIADVLGTSEEDRAEARRRLVEKAKAWARGSRGSTRSGR